MKKLFKWLLLLTVALVIGISILLYNPALLKGPLENYLSKLSGYSISLTGELEISTGRKSMLSATGIQVSNPEWPAGGNLLTIGKLSIELDRASIFQHTLIVESLQIEDLDINPETNAEGKGNWATTRPEPSLEPSDDDGEDWHPPVLFKKIELSESSVRYLNGETGKEQNLLISSFDLHPQDDGMLEIILDGTLNERPVAYSGNIGPFANLIEGEDIAISGQGNFGSLDISGEILIDDLLAPGQPKFNIDLEGPDIDEITEMLGIDDLGSGGFSVSGRGKAVNGRYEAGINGHIGDISLSISAQGSEISNFDDVNTKLAITGPSLGALTRIFGLKDWPDKPFSLKGDVERTGSTFNVSALTLSIGGSQLILDALLTNFPHLDASRVNLSIKGDDVAQFRELLGIKGVATGAYEISGNLDVSPDEVELVQLELKTSLGHATVSGSLGPAPSYVGTKLHVHLEGPNAHLLISAIGIDALPEHPFNLDTHVELVEEGIQVERSVLVSINDDRLELGGLIGLKKGGAGTDLELKISGENLSEMLRSLLGKVQFPATPYEVSGRLKLENESIELQNVNADFEDIKLSSNVLIMPGNQFVGTGFDFQIEGENLSTLKVFPVIGDSLDIFVSGQPYQARGRLAIENGGWRLQKIAGQIGKTDFELDGLLSPKNEWTGSNVLFSIKGPGLESLLNSTDDSSFPIGPFSSKGTAALSDDSLSFSDFSFQTNRAQAKIDLQMGWPFNSSKDINFNIDMQGDDLRHLIPHTDKFEPAKAAFDIKAVGQRTGKLISLQNFEADIGNLQISLKGSMNKGSTDENVDLSFSANSTDLSTLGKINGEPLPSQPLDLKATLNGNASEFTIRKFQGAFGDSRFEGKADISLNGPRPFIDLNVNATHFDMRPFLADDETPDDKTDESGSSPDGRKIPATPIPLDALALFDGNFILNIDEIRHHQDIMRDFVFEAKLQDDRLDVSKAIIKGPKGHISSSFTIHPAEAEKRGMVIDLTAEDFFLNLSGLPEDEFDTAPAFDLLVNIRVNGNNLQELAGSLNGTILMGTGGGTLKGLDLSILDTFVLDAMFSLIVPKDTQKDDVQELTCAATILKITEGLIETNPSLAFSTEKMALVAKGTLDLKTEQMMFNFTATPSNAFQISASELFHPYILVSGTLSDPKVGIDEKKALLHGGAAIGTMGVSILAKGLIDRAAQVVPPCTEMLKKVQQQQ